MVAIAKMAQAFYLLGQWSGGFPPSSGTMIV